MDEKIKAKETDPREQAFIAWLQRIQKMIDNEIGTVSLKGIAVSDLTRKDFMYFSNWEKGKDATALDIWSRVLKPSQSSSQKLLNYCRQQQTAKSLEQ